MIGKLRGTRFRRCRGRQVHLGFGLLGLAAKTDAEADLLQLPGTDALGVGGRDWLAARATVPSVP